MSDQHELLQIAILSYRSGRFTEAMQTLHELIDADAHNWLARLYLGMTHHKAGQVTDAQRLFKRLAAECNDEDIQAKAENALVMVEAELQRKFSKTTGSIPALQKPPDYTVKDKSESLDEDGRHVIGS